MTKRAGARLVFAIWAVFFCDARAQTLQEGLSAYRANHVAEAERILGQVAADPAAEADDRSAARRELARIDWLIRGETDALTAALQQSAGDGQQRCDTLMLALRVYREAGDPGAALQYAEATRQACVLTPDRARLGIARAHLAAGHLEEAAAELAPITGPSLRNPEFASARFALAMAQRNSEAAFAAWRDYYWLGDADAPQAMAMYSGRVQALFRTGLAPDAPEADAAALTDMLVRAGFTQEAEALAQGREGPLWISARAYFAFDHAVRDSTLRANRLMASGQRANFYAGEVQAAMGALMQAASLEGDPQAALLEAYGLFGTLGETSGYPSLHGGHVAQDEAMNVEQYGRTGQMRFIVIDNMLANGFESWLWDGWAEAGGWSSDGNLIVQVRSAYTDGPFGELRRARPGPVRERFLADLERAAGAERAALGRDGVAELPATADRLILQVDDAIAARFGDDDAAFIAEMWRATNQYSIESHEGRHALDNAAEPGHSTPDLEYRAKLSQIIFADYPKLGLASVAGQALNRTPHGIANRRVLRVYRDWMRAHREEIADFDASAPSLTQLDKLTDDQIVAIARSVDPWARAQRAR